jgi:hypothetical protein
MDKSQSEPELEQAKTVMNGEGAVKYPFLGVTISGVQKAIHERMLRYAGEGGKGIDGVWNAIDSQYKYPDSV